MNSIFKNSIFGHWKKNSLFVTENVAHSGTEPPWLLSHFCKAEVRGTLTYHPRGEDCATWQKETARHFVNKVVLSNTPVHLRRWNYWIAEQLSIWTEMPNLWRIAHYPQSGQNNGGACRNSPHIWSRTCGTNPSPEAKGIILVRFFLLLVLWKKSHFPMK